MSDDPAEGQVMIDVELGRVILREHSLNAPQYIYLREVGGQRSFPIVIGLPEAMEIQRILTGVKTERPLTHQLLSEVMGSLGAHLKHVDIVDIRHNTFFAQLVLADEKDETVAIVDSRPSDSIALCLRAGCPLRVTESVLEQVRTDESGDPLGGGPAPGPGPNPGPGPGPAPGGPEEDPTGGEAPDF